MKKYWWIVDEWGMLNLFDSAEAFRRARNHVHGLMGYDTSLYGDFQAEGVKDCWTMEELLKWNEGVKDE